MLNIILKIINIFKNNFKIYILLLLSVSIVFVTIHPQLIFPNFKYTSVAISYALVFIEILVILLCWNFYYKTIKNFNYLKKNEDDYHLMLGILEAETSFNFKFCSIAFTVIGALFFGFYYTYTQSLTIDAQKISLASNFVSLAGNIRESDILSSAATIEALSNYAVDLQDYGIEYIQKPLNIITTTMDFARTKVILNSKNIKSYNLLFDNCKKSISYILRANKQKDLNLERTDLSGLDLKSAYLEGVTLTKANLSRADLWYANLSEANLENANLRGTDLMDANLSRIVLVNADLSEAVLVHANLIGADLVNANLREANLMRAYLRVAALSGANLSKAHLSYANLSGAHLNDANLSEAQMRSTDLRETDLERADLSGAVLILADLSGANLSYANLSGTTFVLVNGLTIEQLESAIIDKNTKLPPEFELNRERFLETSKENLKKRKNKLD